MVFFRATSRTNRLGTLASRNCLPCVQPRPHVLQGGAQNYVQAHLWFNLAASRYEDTKLRQDAVYNRDQVAAKMTPAQIDEAQRLASEWKPK